MDCVDTDSVALQPLVPLNVCNAFVYRSMLHASFVKIGGGARIDSGLEGVLSVARFFHLALEPSLLGCSLFCVFVKTTRRFDKRIGVVWRYKWR